MKALAVFPLVLAILFGIACVFVPLFRVEIETVKILALVGCLVAAFSFERGDYLRTAWLFSGGCLFLLLSRDLTLVFVLEKNLPAIDIVRGVLVILANVSSVTGTWMLARAWSIAGFGKRASIDTIMLAGAIAIALGITGYPLVTHVRALVHDFSVMPLVASDLGDMIGLVLIAPVLGTALAMRGGKLIWPWSFLAASGISWLLYDALGSKIIPMDPQTGRILTEAMRALACTYLFSAGIAQRLSIT